MSENYKAVVIGASAGGIEALRYLFSQLPEKFPLPVAAVLHVHPDTYSIMSLFENSSNIPVTEAEDGEMMTAGHIYLAPPGYHMLIERSETLTIAVFERILFSRPSIDPLFFSASNVYGKSLIGIILTGANNDGSAGMRSIKDQGGCVIIQNPENAEVSSMPVNALKLVPEADFVVSLNDIVPLLCNLTGYKMG